MPHFEIKQPQNRSTSPRSGEVDLRSKFGEGSQLQRGTVTPPALRVDLSLGRGASPYCPLVRRAAFGASSFSFSNAPGIIWPNIELSIAVGIRPALLPSCPCPPDIRNCGTRGWLIRVSASANFAKFCSASRYSGPP
jgi:hypothetical protein